MNIKTLFFILLLSIPLLSACSTSQPSPTSYAVGIYNLSESHVDSDSGPLDRLSFTVQNQEPFDLECSILMVLDHPTNSSKKKGSLGIIPAGSSKEAAFTFKMPEGDTEISFRPICAKP